MRQQPTRLQSVRRFLRSPGLVTAELLGVVAAGVAGTFAPAVFGSPVFLALVLLSALSVAIVAWDQWVRGVAEWRFTPTEGAFAGTPFRTELLRRRRPGGWSGVRVENRLGAFGPALFHAGLLVLMLAGVGRLLWGAEAFVDLVEGEAMPSSAGGFGAQFLGPLAAPIVLPEPVALRELRPSWYASGALRSLEATLTLHARGEASSVDLAVNAPLALGDANLYMQQQLGIAALMELKGGPHPAKWLALLAPDEAGGYLSRDVLEGGLDVRLRGSRSGDAPGARVELRALEGGALRVVAELGEGASVALRGDRTLTLHGLRWWARFGVTRDRTAWPAYVGMAVMLLGALSMVALVRVELLVGVTPEGERERVVVALRARRLQPLFAERFERIVCAERDGSEP